MRGREVAGRLAAWWRRDALDRELAEELATHAELLARDFEHEGMSPSEARVAARRRLGNLTALREQSRDAWGFPALERLRQDVRYAIRSLWRAPGFALAAILTFGLGIGANAAMFGVLDQLMLRPLPYLRDPGTAHLVYIRTTYEGRTSWNTVFPYTRYLDLERETSHFDTFAAVSEWRVAVGGAGEDVRVRDIAGVSAAFFDFFDAPPVRGRYFLPDEDVRPSGTRVAVISHDFWRSAFGSAAVIGRPLKLGRLEYAIIGVAPPGFVGTAVNGAPDVFVPITTIPANIAPADAQTYFSRYHWDWTMVLARRKPGIAPELASLDLTQGYIRSRAAARAINPRVLPDSLVQPAAFVGPIKQAAGPGAGLESRVLLWIAGVAAVVLLIACASVANLMVARVIRRRREITVRLALGVSRGRLLSQYLTESLVLALSGGVVGMLVAQWSGAAIHALILPAAVPFRLADQWRTAAIALACIVLCALLTALGPMLVARRTDLTSALKSGVRGGAQRSRLQRTLVVLQVSLSVVLLVGAALFVRSFARARALPLGYDPKPVLEVIPDFRGMVDGDSAIAAARRHLLATAQALPGVRHAAPVNSQLFATNTATLRVPGIDSVTALGRFNIQLSTADYFRVLQIPILRGRGLEATDRRGTLPVVVVSAAMAEALWPGRDPLGQCIHVTLGDSEAIDKAPCTEVVGVAENTRQQNLDDDPMFMYYLPWEQHFARPPGTLLLRMALPDPSGDVERVRRELTRAMPGDGLVVVRPLQQRVDSRQRSWRLGATLFVIFGGLAFVVAVVGLYGVISYDVAGRMHELGVRVALGAQPARVMRLVVANGVRLVLGGITIGVALSLAASRWVEPLLFQQSARDPAVYLLVAVTMLVVAVVASLVPARRAARADPITSLRAD